MFSWEKQCLICGQVKPVFYFHRQKQYNGRQVSVIITDECRQCSDPTFHHLNDEDRALNLFRRSTFWPKCLAYWGHSCAVCKRSKADGVHLALDHWRPRTKGFVVSPLNIIPLCQGKRGCNNNKNNRESLDWLCFWLGDEIGCAKYVEIETYFAQLILQEAVGMK